MKGHSRNKVAKKELEAQKEWRRQVLERDGHKCQICDPSVVAKRLNVHHLIPRGIKEYRWDVDNGMTLCVRHHTLGTFSAHKHPFWFVNWLWKTKPKIYFQMERRNALAYSEAG